MRKIIIVLLLCVFSIDLTACSNNGVDTPKESIEKNNEYNIEDFGPLYDKTNKLFEKESEYLTKEELVGDKAYSIYEKCSKEIGLPFNETITLRGKKESSLSGFNITSADGEYSISCFFSEGTPNDSLFIKDGENIVVSGVFSENVDSYGCLTNVTIELPQNIDIIYENNIDSVLSDYENISGTSIVQGELDSILSLEEFEHGIELMSYATYEHQDNYFDTVASLKGEEGSIFFMYNKENYTDLKVGDKVVISGFVDDLIHVTDIDGKIEVISGLMGNIYEIYIFN
ncbi:hypothetical protein GN277_18395 [Lachnospiraceae bacterium WCA-9-b2]|uniref:Lipoprotein n=1 Tax=Sporofaciens musculi TaxID=2681861 RepID=A0A7X3SKD3_9FIRM|nr:hypothetical protein [Sporofaciens musculi]MXP77275.1 hypothetical protein [Sporofaciens musculi]